MALAAPPCSAEFRPSLGINRVVPRSRDVRSRSIERSAFKLVGGPLIYSCLRRWEGTLGLELFGVPYDVINSYEVKKGQ